MSYPPGVVMAAKYTEEIVLRKSKGHFWCRCILSCTMCLLLVALGVHVLMIWYCDAFSNLPKEAFFVTTAENYEYGGENLLEEKFSANLLVQSKSYCSIESCGTVTCNSVPGNMDAGQIAGNFIDTVYKKMCANSNTVLRLKFVNSTFPENKLCESWLKIDVKLSELTFENCRLIEIHENAFSKNIFKDLTSLSITRNNIESFKKLIFRNFSNLQSLSIRENRIIQVDPNLLKYVGKTLQSLQLDQSIYDVNVLYNLTGKTSLPKLQILSIRDNSIRKISSVTFQGIPNVKSLYMDRSEIQKIDESSFIPFAKSIRQINLNNNKITTLSKLLLSSILNSNKQFKLTIHENPWNCDCELEWMKSLIKDHPNIFQAIPNCQTPLYNTDKSFVDATFCEISTSQVPIVTPETTKDSSTAFPQDGTTLSQLPLNVTTANPTTEIRGDPNTVKLICQDLSDWRKNSRILLSTVDYEFESRYPEFSIEEMDDYTVLINLTSADATFTLIWYKSKTTYTNESLTEFVKCVKNIKSSYIVSDLQPGSSYVICLMVKDERNPSPFNCLPLMTKPTYESRVWLTNRHKVTAILLLSALVISFCILGALLSFFVIRRNPALLRGSKRVMVVRHRTADAIVLPEGVQISSRRNGKTLKVSNESETFHTTGYITPIGKRRPLIRKDSNTSGVSSHSSGTSYVSGIEPTVGQLMSWRIGRIKNKISLKEVQVPPPLPPHPQHGLIPSLSLNVDSARDEEWNQEN
ncbi:leucine-rich repeat transmembrane protein FLRT3 isoform X1 [Cephus cinctus]|uniref:Leucine-rich repeat transmembrane protein FLRT3 isoform X1 n=1 Tax=Cephus cinctus TaxID=211228 RepID=A0AAJ7RP76_CEPCN|nr:leucine-rich repeat transmembrane protein FLRT3 isoform X1 [Cephus cinctus]